MPPQCVEGWDEETRDRQGPKTVLILRLHWHVRPGRTVPARCCLVERASVNATGPNCERAGVGWPGPFDLSELARCGPVPSSSVNASRLLG